MLQESGRGFDSNELKLRFVVEYRGGKWLSRLRWEDEEDKEEETEELEVRSRVMVGNEGDDEIDEFGR